MADKETPVEAQLEKHPGGRPLAFATVGELKQAVDSYFNKCDPHTEMRQVEAGVNQAGETIWQRREIMTEQRPYTMSGLARHLEIDRKTLLNYKKIEQYFPTVEAARERVHEFAEEQLYGKSAGGAQFVLKNNFDWKDRSEVDLTTKDQPLAMVEFIGGGSTTNSQDPVS
ncbi:hypothetical protein E3O44_12610 [Cryobacterium algoricola]|uniref:Uncharacterized protein n=1 Tax=Cryobacterium algoricola TaxID=1259183 RepID=A0ABY2IB52_9MICO|nr:terminase small subunit [Cryobacterium algoricola]TFB85837.1 hypothetical protein E3O44_12610 [Cryobacterium algoricola]